MTLSEKGREALQKKRVGCLLVAGGQGTRLKYDAPKGTYPISPVTNKSLFQIFAEKVVAASEMAGVKLPLAIMTSPQNDRETRTFFQEHSLFGLEPSQLSFFVSEDLPLLDDDGNTVGYGAAGNGNAIPSFKKSGIYDTWRSQGIDTLTFVQVDNPLADPFPLELIGTHLEKQADATIQCIERTDPQEPVGVVIQEEKKVLVKEYSEIDPQEQTARKEDGSLLHPLANISLFCFSLDFFGKAADQFDTFPLHRARKANAWKSETFIFDILQLTEKTAIYTAPRNLCFAPLKNSSSPPLVTAALLEENRILYHTLTGLEPPSTPFELSPRFFYTTPKEREQWKGKPLPIIG